MNPQKFQMIEQPPRGGIKEGITFGYVDIPSVITEKDRPFLNQLTDASLDLQREMRKGTAIPIQSEDKIYESHGHPVKARVYFPEGEGPFPLVLYLHGGGFAIRNVDCFDFIARYIAKESGSVVLAIDYSLSPEHKFPIAAEECFDGYLWAIQHAEEFRADPQKIIVAGDSAGGNLSTVLCMMCRDKNIQPPISQILAYPVVDMGSSVDRESYRIYGEHYNLDYKHVVSYNCAYVHDENDFLNPYVSPLYADDLSELPPCLIISAECDILIDQGLEYAKRLKDAGVPVSYKIFRGVPHDFLFFNYQESYEAYDLICSFIKRAAIQ
jgi:acetyl esterase